MLYSWLINKSSTVNVHTIVLQFEGIKFSTDCRWCIKGKNLVFCTYTFNILKNLITKRYDLFLHLFARNQNLFCFSNELNKAGYKRKEKKRGW